MAAPTYFPEWATEDTTLPQTGKSNKIRPKESLRSIGWDKGQIPSAEEINWVFNNYYLWLQYIIDEALPAYLPLSGTELDFKGNIQGTASWSGNAITSVNLTSDLDNSTSSATASTLVKRDTSGGANFSSLGVSGTATLTKADINSGTIDATVIGSETPSSAKFSSLSATTADIDGGTIDSTSVGSTSRSSGAFTTLAANGQTTLSGPISSTGTNNFSGSNTFSSRLNLQSSNLAQTGYTYLPNGVIMQWGYLSAGDDSWTQITFPIPFPTTCTSLTANANYNGAITGQNGLSTHTYIDSSSVGHVGITWTSSTSISINGFSWLAIGY